MKTIRLSGELGSKFGRVHRFALDTNTVQEAMSALMSQHPALSAYLTGAKDRGVGFAVFIGGTNIGEDALAMPTGNDEIRIAPVLMGSKRAGVLQIIVGVVLVLLGTYATIFAGPVGTAMVSAGWGMIIGGAVQLLTPIPKGIHAKDAPANTPSYTFNGPINTQAQGNPKPLFYGGPMKIGSSVISAGITAEDHSISGPIGGSGNMGFKQIGSNNPRESTL